jgi:hypothetical protein
MKAATVIAGQPSWTLESDRVIAQLTRLGGHLGPVTFRIGGRDIQPFSIAPWAEEKSAAGAPPLLTVLRGDFFCCPFGIDRGKPFRGQVTPPHGETCNSLWTLRRSKTEPGTTALRATMDMRFRPGRVTKEVFLRDGHTAVYQRHTLEGLAGPLTLGHHPMLKFPDTENSGLISTSDFSVGQVFPEPLGVPAQGSYSALKPGARFTRLDRVPLALGGHADLSAFPARRGYDDLVQLLTRPVQPFAWTAVTFPEQGYAWFALKDPRVLNSTLLWISNGGRYPPPWNGRHTAVMGLEEVTGYFDYGVAASLKHHFSVRRAHATTLSRSPMRPLVVNYVMALADIPRDFGSVRAVLPVQGGVELRGTGSSSVRLPLDVGFLAGKAPT